MKRLYITLQGQGNVYWFEDLEIPIINRNLTVLLSDSEKPVWSKDDTDAIDITEKIGEPVVKVDYLQSTYELTLPVSCTMTRNEIEITELFCLELEDDFDPKKLRIWRSQYESKCVCGSVVTDVSYDDKDIHYEIPEGYYVEDKVFAIIE